MKKKKKKIEPRGKLCQVSHEARNEQLYEGSFAALGSSHIVPIALKAGLLPHRHLRPRRSQQRQPEIKRGAHRRCDLIQQGLLLSCIEVFFVPTGVLPLGSQAY